MRFQEKGCCDEVIAFKISVACQVAMRAAQEMEAKLAEEEEICNETMKALWEECKPCLRNTCVKFYSRTCSSGSGLVGRQVRAARADMRHTQSTYEKWVENINRCWSTPSFHEDGIQPAGLYCCLSLRHTFILTSRNAMAVFSLYVQLEDVLNRTSPFSIWINGEKMDFLQQEGQRQDKALTNLEEKYTEMADGVDSIVSDSMKVKPWTQAEIQIT